MDYWGRQIAYPNGWFPTPMRLGEPGRGCGVPGERVGRVGAPGSRAQARAAVAALADSCAVDHPAYSALIP